MTGSARVIETPSSVILPDICYKKHYKDKYLQNFIISHGVVDALTLVAMNPTVERRADELD
ncbi:hypothetical protein [Aggregatilinea lenta]|uniref:hypothetical protein n=1 Tax=Aggregatilinea lenta TaxID=913108 RepID=UPI0013C30D87|nr:hypothetical protein [Aggregatilinea lenta]